MRAWVLLWGGALIACGATTGQTTGSGAAVASPEDDERATCRDLDSPDLELRRSAGERLRSRVPVVEGGTEQAMEGAAAWCESTFGLRPSWLPRPGGEATLAPTPATVEECELPLVPVPGWAGWRDSGATDPCQRLSRCAQADCAAADCLLRHYGCLDSGSIALRQESQLGSAYFVTVGCCPE